MHTRPSQSGIEIEVLAATATAAIEWVWSAFPGRVCVLSSMQDAVVIDLVMRVDRRIPIVFLDTGYHFDETLDTAARVDQRYGIRVETIRSSAARRDEIEPGECCAGKAEMLSQALADGARSGRWAGTDRTECGLHL